MTRKIMVSFFCIILAIGLLGCGRAETPDAETEPLETGYPLTITDSLRREVILEKAPRKLISLAPAITEILFAIGADEQLVGVTEYCDYPAEAQKLPQVGDFANPNFEVIVDSEPEVIFVAAGIQEDLIERFTQLGIKVIALDAENVEQVLENILSAGEITNHSQEAEELVANLEQRIKTVKEKVAASSNTPTVFFEVWDDPLMTAGPGSFIHDLIQLAGGENIAGDVADRFVEFSQEVLLERNPEIYLLNNHAHQPEDIKTRPGYGGLQAVQNNQVYTVEDDLVTLPGPRIVDGLEQMAKIIHPEVF